MTLPSELPLQGWRWICTHCGSSNAGDATSCHVCGRVPEDTPPRHYTDMDFD